MSVFIEVHIEGRLRYRWKICITQLTSTWEERVDERTVQVQQHIDQLRQNVMPSLRDPSTEYFIVFESKMNNYEYEENNPDN